MQPRKTKLRIGHWRRPHYWGLLSLLLIWTVGGRLSELDPYLTDVLIAIGINIILASSLNLINGHAGQFSLGHAGFMAVGAYGAAAVTMHLWPLLPGAGFEGLPGLLALPTAMLLGGALACLAGILVGIPSLRLRGDYLALVTLGFGEIIRVLLQNCEPLGGALGLYGIPALTTPQWTFTAATLCVLTVFLLVHSTRGLRLLATRDDEIAAQACGIHVARIKLQAFLVGAFFAGVAGALFGHFKLSLDPKGFDFSRSIEIVIMVILGGAGRTWGVIAAAILLTILPEYLRSFSEYRIILYAFILILVMILRPHGLMGRMKPPAPPLHD